MEMLSRDLADKLYHFEVHCFMFDALFELSLENVLSEF